VPADVHDVGLWTEGAPPVNSLGGPLAEGTTLLAGHVNALGQGSGSLAGLYRVVPGAFIYVTSAHVVTTWSVVSATAIAKADLPTAVFAGSAGPRRLVLVTCGGAIHHVRGHGWTYDDNVVVTAVPA
jgi:hypothetical protein